MYQLTRGIFLLDTAEIVDARLNIKYQNQVLYLFLNDVQNGKLTDIDKYLEELRIDEMFKGTVYDCIVYCLKMNFIMKFSILFHCSIWYESRFKMQIMFLSKVIIWLLITLPFIFINTIINSSITYFFINFYVIHLLSIYIHESIHALFYWLFQTSANGYFKLGYYSFSFVYNDEFLSRAMKFWIGCSASLLTMITLSILMVHTSEYSYLFLIEIIIQLFSLIFGMDGKIAYNAIK